MGGWHLLCSDRWRRTFETKWSSVYKQNSSANLVYSNVEVIWYTNKNIFHSVFQMYIYKYIKTDVIRKKFYFDIILNISLPFKLWGIDFRTNHELQVCTLINLFILKSTFFTLLCRKFYYNPTVLRPSSPSHNGQCLLSPRTAHVCPFIYLASDGMSWVSWPNMSFGWCQRSF